MKTLTAIMLLCLTACERPMPLNEPLERTPPAPVIDRRVTKTIAAKRTRKKSNPLKMSGMIIGAKRDYFLKAQDGDEIKVNSTLYYDVNIGDRVKSLDWK